jgi:UDP-N-acetylmuramyl pentapeptide phosphotransferase/UDP-N-acetylglucosamine-1-phosphate transferase
MFWEKVGAGAILLIGIVFFTDRYFFARGKTRTFRAKAAALVMSLVGTFFFYYVYMLVGFAAGYGVKKADRDLVLFHWAAIVCGLVFLGCAISLLWEAFRRRRGHRTGG